VTRRRSATGSGGRTEREVAGTQKSAGTNHSGVPSCTEADCDREAAVVVYVPWAEDRPVCAAHGRVLVQQDGVVARPITDAPEWG